MKFLQCFWYLILISILSFPLGRVLPKRWFRWNRFPFRSFSFERDGRIYEKLQIRKWKTKVPDMSRILPFLMPAKAFSADYEKKLPRMIEEACVAEWIHGLNCLAGLYCIKLWPGMGGVLLALIYATVFNVPFMLIQRYNRPRLIALARRMEEKKRERGEP